jgi:uncharacterized SAM-binding protein YcdF (DUF218 family)
VIGKSRRRASSPRSRRRTAAVVLLLCTLFWLAVAGRLFVWPATSNVRPVDVVAVFAGGGDRADRGVELIEEGVADTIVFTSAWVEELDLWAQAYCNSRRVEVPAAVVCFDPDPSTTQGEARGLTNLAAANGWDEILLVVSTDQVWRARLLMGRCWDGDLLVVAVDHDQPALFRMIYETGASLNALVLKRRC